MFRTVLSILMGLICLTLPPVASAAESTGAGNAENILTLKKVIAMTLTQNPELAAFSLEKRVREARTLQSGLLPNPELGITVEDAAGTGQTGGFGRSETTIRLSQLIELGGKRAARIQAGTLSQKLADWDYEIKRMDILTQASKAFIEVLKSQQKLSLANDFIRLGEQITNAVSERVKAGKVPAIEKTKAEVALSVLRIEKARSRLELENARRRLSALWGESNPQFDSVDGDHFDNTSPPPDLENLIGQLSQNPLLSRWSTAVEERQAQLEVEISKEIPNLTLSGGYRRLEETSDNALVFGVSIPLPLFNRNQGAIDEARSLLAKTEKEKRAFELKTTRALSETYGALTFSYGQVISIKTEILPGAQKAVDAVGEGYQFGKFGLLDALDSQKTYFQARSQYLEALADYHKALADVERLTGAPLATVRSMDQTGDIRP